MPLIKSGSKKAFQKNVKAEMEAHPGADHRAQNLAIAYSIKRKNRKKMADGGKVQSDMSGGQKRGPEGYPKYQEQAQNEKGVHTPVSGVTQFPGGKGTSEAGDMAKERYAGKPMKELVEHSKNLHKKKLHEMRSMKKPNLYAEGGDVEDQDEIEQNDHAHEDMVNAKHEIRPMPDESDHESDDYDKAMERRNSSRHSIADQDWSDRGRGQASEESHYEMKKPKIADGDPMQEHLYEEEDDLIDHDAPGTEIVDAIMRKRQKYASGGEVDLSRNADEDPNMEDQLSYEALKKENYSESEGLAQLNQPEDSNEHGHDMRDEDSFDMIEKMRRKIKSKRGF